MTEVKFTPLEKLTAEDVKKMIIHSTRSSIRRAAAVKPFTTVPATDNCPTLTYIHEVDPITKEESFSIHALSADITRFLLLQHVEDASDDSSDDSADSSDE